MRCGILAGVVVALVVAGCSAGGGADPAARPSYEAPALRVSFERPRYLVVQRKAELILVNEGDTPITVDTLQLDSDWFERESPTLRGVEVAPGQRIDVPVPYGEARCDVANPRHRAALRIPGVGATTMDLQGADEALELVHTEECNRMAIEAAAEISIENLRRTGGAPEYPMRGEVVVRRKAGDDAVIIDSLRGGVIFLLNPVRDATPVLELAPGETEARAPVLFEILRCDPHGMAESKKTYRFPFYVALGEGEAQYVEVEPHGDARALMEATLDECANG